MTALVPTRYGLSFKLEISRLRSMTRILLSVFICAMGVACGEDFPQQPEKRLVKATRELKKAKTEIHRFYALAEVAKESFVNGKTQDAMTYAKELEGMLSKYPSDWNYGNAIHDFNMVLGRIALAEGRVAEAKGHLIAAGKSPGSPQLNSFGPNMSLAEDLLKKGEKDSVLEYFGLCRKFWKLGEERLDQWSESIKAGKTPDFRANLVY